MSDQASTIMVNTLEPQSGTTLTVGKSGQNLVVNADSLKANVVKDAGANAVFTSDGSGNLSGLNSAFGSAQVLISTTTVSTAVANISFTSGIDSTYKEYVFEFINMNPATNSVNWSFQVNASGQTGFNETLTSSAFMAQHAENDTDSGLGNQGGHAQEQGTAYQTLNYNTANFADASVSGELHFFNPASTTYVKNFYSCTNEMLEASYTINFFTSGYINTASAITEIDFKFSSGNINAGKIKMYGIK